MNWRRALVLVAALLLALVLFHPVREARLYADDNAFVTLARHLDEPWRLLTQDVLGQFFFRPLGLAFWWLAVTVVGTGPAHYLLDILLHFATCALAFAWLRRFTVSTPVALACCAALAAHPTAFATLGWLANRFDLLVALFGMATFVAVSRFRDQPSPIAGAGVVLLAFAAMSSKETGFAVPMLAVGLLAEPWSRHPPGQRAARVALGVALLASIALAFAIRAVVVRDIAAPMFFAGGVVTPIWLGVVRMASFAFDYLAPHAGSRLAFATWLVFLLVVVGGGVHGIARRQLDRSLAVVMLAGLGLIVLTAMAQAPVARVSPIVPYRFDEHPLDARQYDIMVANRFFYLPLIGAFMILAALAECGARAAQLATSKGRGMAWMLISVLALIALSTSARSVGRDWAQFTQRQDATLTDAAVRAVANLPNVAPACKVFLLDTHATSPNFQYFADVLVKQGLPKDHPAVGCFVQAEAAPWFYLVDHRRHPKDEIAPLESVMFRGAPYPPVRVGNLSTYFLKIPDTDAVRRDPGSTFLSFDGREFRDVTREVREGVRVPRFRDNR